MRILVIGDFHIPERAERIPKKIVDKISKEKFDLILCTGDLTERKVLEFLSSIAPVKWVMGNMDYLTGPLMEKVRIGDLRIGLIHGTEIYPRGDVRQLHMKARELGVNILISGHTHAADIKLVEGILLLNPGSATGVWGGYRYASMIPSFMILEITENGRKILVRLYELKNILKETRREFILSEKGLSEI